MSSIDSWRRLTGEALIWFVDGREILSVESPVQTLSSHVRKYLFQKYLQTSNVRQEVLDSQDVDWMDLQPIKAQERATLINTCKLWRFSAFKSEEEQLCRHKFREVSAKQCKTCFWKRLRRWIWMHILPAPPGSTVFRGQTCGLDTSRRTYSRSEQQSVQQWLVNICARWKSATQSQEYHFTSERLF